MVRDASKGGGGRETDEAERIARAVEALLAERSRSAESVERALGWEEGRLGRLLGDGGEATDLGLRELFAILAELGVTPRRFFAEVYGLAPAGASEDVEALAGEIDFPEIRRMIRRTVREELSAGGGRLVRPRRPRDDEP